MESPDLESFTAFLTSKHLIDYNEDLPDQETLTKFLSIYQGFSESDSQNSSNEGMPFETKAIFTLADFLK